MVGSLFTLLAAFMMLACQRFEPKADEEQGHSMVKVTSEFGEDFKDETGSAKDVKELGEFVANLLTRRHYKWVSHRRSVEQLMEEVFPELDTSSRETYYGGVRSLIRAPIFETSWRF